jgi:hypothetical protein
LRFGEALERRARLFELLDVDRESRDARIAQRHVDDLQAASLAADGGGHYAGNRLAAFPRRCCSGDRVAAGRGLDQLQSAPDHVGSVRRLDSRDICAVDEGEPQVGPAMPHRDRRGFDQPGQGIEGLGQAVRLF